MLPTAYPPFIFTSFFTASHIMLQPNEEHVVLAGMYCNLVTGRLESIEISCSFNQFNDIMYCNGDGADEIMEQVADTLNMHASMPNVLDVTGTGGLSCDRFLYCLQEVKEQPGEEKQYHLFSYTYKQPGFDYNVFMQPPSRQNRFDYYASALAIQYSFYQKFVEEMLIEDAIFYAGLSSPIVFEMAKLKHEAINKTSAA